MKIKNLTNNTDFLRLPDEGLSVIQEIDTGTSIKLYIKRDDLVHAYLSGNKWRKLKYNLTEAIKQGRNTLLTFGGAYSNHIYAVASAGQLYDFRTVGIIRGEEEREMNSTLSFARDCGMQLDFITREDYRNKTDAGFIEALANKYGDFYLLPEGGTNELAIKGCSEIFSEEEYDTYDYICCSCGTGGTLSGIISGSKGKSALLGFSVLKGGFLKSEIENMVNKFTGTQFDNWKMIEDYHFGGYARTNPELQKFIDEFTARTGIPTEFVYSGKMFYGIFDMIEKGFFPLGSKVLALHTGGMRRES